MVRIFDFKMNFIAARITSPRFVRVSLRQMAVSSLSKGISITLNFYESIGMLRRGDNHESQNLKTSIWEMINTIKTSILAPKVCRIFQITPTPPLAIQNLAKVHLNLLKWRISVTVACRSLTKMSTFQRSAGIFGQFLACSAAWGTPFLTGIWVRDAYWLLRVEAFQV